MIALEQLADGSPADRNFHKLTNLVIDTGGQNVGIRFGTATLTWPGATAVASTLTVNHGLGRTPAVVIVTPTLGAATYIPVVETFSYTSTTFSANAITSDNSNPAASTTKTFAWVVIG